jgi:hypothetical protein
MKHPAVKRLRASLDETARTLYATREVLRLEMAKNSPKQARLAVDGGMTAESISEALAGTLETPIMKAVLSVVNQKVVELCDRATDAPRQQIVLPDRIIPGYGSEERMHDAGGAAHTAAVLEMLQDLSRPKDEKQEAQAA